MSPFRGGICDAQLRQEVLVHRGIYVMPQLKDKKFHIGKIIEDISNLRQEDICWVYK